MTYNYFLTAIPVFSTREMSSEELAFLKIILRFDEGFYCATYPDVAKACIDPFEHFIEHGLREGRLPAALNEQGNGILACIGFDAADYSEIHPDVNFDVRDHFVRYGIAEQRYAYNRLKNLQDEQFALDFIARMGITYRTSLEEPISAVIGQAETLLATYWRAAAYHGVARRTFRNNFWMVLAMLALARGWLGIAKASYSFFFNYYIPMPLLGNANGMVVETARIHKVMDYARRHALFTRPLPADQRVLVPTPIFLNGPAVSRPDEWHDLPRPHYVQLVDVVAMGESALIRVGVHDYLYDYLDEPGERSAEIKSQMIMHNINGWCAIRGRSTEHYVEEAFSLLHDHSHNYFHWLLEVLPRLLLARDQGLVGDVPLLVHDRIAPQMEELLTQVLGKPPTLIKIKTGSGVQVRKLHYVTDICHNEVHTRHEPDRRDILLSPTAIRLLREVAAPMFRRGLKPYERVLVTRQNVAFRRLVNREAMEVQLRQHGYFSFDPGAASFAQQVQVFSNARYIVCEAGAAQANLIFCQPGATICILVNGCEYSNYYYLMELGHILGLRVRLVECLRLEGTHELGVQDDMIVHLGELLSCLENLEVEAEDTLTNSTINSAVRVSYP